MSRRAIRYLGRKSARYPLLVLTVVAILTIVAGGAAFERLELELDVAALLPEESEVAQDAARAWEDFGGYDFMLCVLEVKDSAPPAIRDNPSEYLKGISREVRDALSDRRFFNQITSELNQNDLGLGGNDAALVSLLTDKNFGRLEETLLREGLDNSFAQFISSLGDEVTTPALAARQNDPFGLDSILSSAGRVVRGPLKVNAKERYFISEDGEMMLLLLWPSVPFTKIDVGRRLNQFLQDTKKGLYIRNPDWHRSLDIRFTGQHVEAAEGAESVRNNLYETSIVSMIAVLVLFFVAFRQPEALLFVAVPLLVGVIWTLGFASLFVHRVTQITLSFAAIIIGLGIDFSIHLYNRYLESYRNGATVPEALETAIWHTGPTIVAGGLTTCFAFFAMWTTHFQGFQELGMFGGIGIIMCLLAVALTLPPLMVISSGFTKRSNGPLASLGLKKVTFTVLNYPRITVACGLCIATWLGWYATHAGFDEDFRNLQQPSDQYNNLVERIDRHFKTPDNQVLIIVEADDLETALEANDRIYRNIEATDGVYDIIAIDSLRNINPSSSSQAANLNRFANIPINVIENRLNTKASTNSSIPDNYFEPFIARMREKQDVVNLAIEQNEPLLGRGRVDNPVFLRLIQSLVKREEQTGKYRIVTQVFPAKGLWDEAVPEPFIEAVEAGVDIPVTIHGNAILNQTLEGLIVKDLAMLTVATFFIIVLYLSFYFWSVPKALLAMVPVSFALICLLGVISLLGIRLNYLNVIAIPMIVGIGVDSAIHLMGRFYENDQHNMRLAVERTGRAIVITGHTSIFGFGSLSVASFQGIREIGLLAIIGIFCTLFASLLLLPAILRLADPYYRYTGGPGDEIG